MNSTVELDILAQVADLLDLSSIAQKRNDWEAVAMYQFKIRTLING